MFWLVKDKRGYMLFFGAKPEFQDIYISAHPPIGKIPSEVVAELGIKVDEPVSVKLIPAE